MGGFQTAIIGCGTICGIHAAAVQETPEASLAAVVDNDWQKAVAAAGQYDCRYYTDYRQMLQDPQIDVVHICTPHYLHAEMAKQALRSGKHVVLEKPMAISLADAAELTRVADESGKQLGVCFQNRYNSTSLRIKTLLDSGQAGAVRHARAKLQWHRDADYYRNSGWRGAWATEGGGVLINQAIHTLDLLQWFVGELYRIEGATATNGLKGVIEVEDTAQAFLTFTNGVTAEFFATVCNVENDPVELELECKHQTLKLAGDLTVVDRNGGVEQFAEQNVRTGAKAYWGCSHAALIADFYRCLQTGEPFALGGRAAFTALKLVKAIYYSARHHRPVLWEDPGID